MITRDFSILNYKKGRWSKELLTLKEKKLEVIKGRDISQKHNIDQWQDRAFLDFCVHFR